MASNISNLAELGLRLDGLAVFRALLDDPVIGGIRDFCDVRAAGEGARAAITSYAAVMSALYESEAPSLAAYVREAVLADENVYLVRAGSGESVPPSMEKAVTNELVTLQMVADLTKKALTRGLPDRVRVALPGFETESVDLDAAYRERLASVGTRGYGIYARHVAFCVDKAGAIAPVRYPDPIRLSDLVDYEREQKVILDNTRALLEGKPAANILLTGDAGTGKSSTVKAVVNELAPEGLRILEVRKEQLHSIPGVLEQLTRNPLKFVIFIDDLSFTADDDNFTALKAILEGSVSAKSDNVVIYATSNRRHLVKETFSEREGDDVHLNDTLQEIVSLSDRFGIRVSFSRPDKGVYLDIVHKLAAEAGIECDEAELDLEAERFATRRGGRSARGARQFVDSLLSR